MTDRIYSYARTRVHPDTRLRFFALAQPNLTTDCFRAIFQAGPDDEPQRGFMVIEVPTMAVSDV